MTFTSAALPELNARSSAGRISSGFSTYSPCPPNASIIRSNRIAGVKSFGIILAVHVFPHPLVYVGVLEHNPDDGQLESDGGLDVHAVEPEGPVTLQADHRLVGIDDLRGYGEWNSDSHAARDSGVNPLTRIPDRDNLPGNIHRGCSVRDQDGILRQIVAYLLQYAIVTQRHYVGVQHWLDRGGILGGLLFQTAEPWRFTILDRIVVQRIHHLTHYHLGVAHEADFRRVVRANLLIVNVNLDQLIVFGKPGRLSEVEYPVQTRTNQKNRVCPLERLSSRGGDVHRMVRRAVFRRPLET